MKETRYGNKIHRRISTLNKWVQKHQHDDLMSGPHKKVERENERLRKEARLLREEGNLKKGHHLLCRPKFPLIETAFRLPGSRMRFAFIDVWKEVWPVEFLCRVMQVISRGFQACRIHPMSQPLPGSDCL